MQSLVQLQREYARALIRRGVQAGNALDCDEPLLSEPGDEPMTPSEAMALARTFLVERFSNSLEFWVESDPCRWQPVRCGINQDRERPGGWLDRRVAVRLLPKISRQLR